MYEEGENYVDACLLGDDEDLGRARVGEEQHPGMGRTLLGLADS